MTSVQKGKLGNPQNKSCSVVAESSQDALFEVKVNIFLSIANDVAHFLKRYQTDMPMLPFLTPDLFDLVFNPLESLGKDI